MGIYIIFSSCYVRWLNVTAAQLAKTTFDDKENLVKGLNSVIGMVNDHTALLKRLKFMEGDIDELNRDVKETKTDVKKLKNEKKK